MNSMTWFYPCPGNERKAEPPNPSRSEIDADSQSAGDAEFVTEHVECKVQNKQQPAAKVTHCPTVGRDAVALVFTGNIRQIGIIKDHSCPKGQVGENEKYTAQPP